MDQHGTARYGRRLGAVVAIALLTLGTDAVAFPYADATPPVTPQSVPQGVHIVKDTRKYTKITGALTQAGIGLTGEAASIAGEVIYREDQQKLCESNVYLNDPTQVRTDAQYRGTMVVTTYACDDKGDALGIRYIPPTNGANGPGRPASLLPMTMVYGIDKGTPEMMSPATLAGPCADEFHFGDGGVALLTDSQTDNCMYKGRYVLLGSAKFGDSDTKHWIIRVTDRVTRAGDDKKMTLFVLPGKGGFTPGATVVASTVPDRPPNL